MANLLRKLKFPILITLLLTLAVVCGIEKPITVGLGIYLFVYAIFMGTLIYKDKNGNSIPQ